MYRIKSNKTKVLQWIATDDNMWSWWMLRAHSQWCKGDSDLRLHTLKLQMVVWGDSMLCLLGLLYVVGGQVWWGRTRAPATSSNLFAKCWNTVRKILFSLLKLPFAVLLICCPCHQLICKLAQEAVSLQLHKLLKLFLLCVCNCCHGTWCVRCLPFSLCPPNLTGGTCPRLLDNIPWSKSRII